MRFLFYSHDGLGLGHTRRNLAIANALSRQNPDACILIATGIDEIRELGLPEHISTLKLPALRKTGNGSYVARRLRVSSSEIRALRSALLKATVESFRPSVVLVDKHPFGASGEFREGLAELRRQRGKAVLGLRDILDDRDTVIEEWAQHDLLPQIAASYDRVLVYGHPWIFDACEEYSFPKSLAKRTLFCGYVVGRDEEVRNQRVPVRRGSRPVVLATTGGGEDGFFLLDTFIQACNGAPWQGLAVAGPMTPAAEFSALQAIGRENDVSVFRFLPGLPRVLPEVDAVVCMGGYNTLAESLSMGLPAVCVPRISPRREQLIRAQAFERNGFMKVIEPEDLDETTLRNSVEEALKMDRADLLSRVNSSLNFDGAEQAAGELLSVAEKVAVTARLESLPV